MQIAPVGTSIQVGADVLMEIIKSERANAAAAALDQLRRFEQFFNDFKQQTRAMHANDMERVADAQKRLVEMQTQFIQSRDIPPSVSNASNPLPLSRQITAASRSPDQTRPVDSHTVPTGSEEESLAKQQLDNIQTALKEVGIIFSTEDNLLNFGVGWDAVLAELGNSSSRILSSGTLLQRLTDRLQRDREAIAILKQKLSDSVEARENADKTYKMDIAALKLKVLMFQDNAALQDAAATQSPPGTPQSPDVPLAHSFPRQFPPRSSPTINPAHQASSSELFIYPELHYHSHVFNQATIDTNDLHRPAHPPNQSSAISQTKPRPRSLPQIALSSILGLGSLDQPPVNH